MALTSDWKSSPESLTSLDFQVGDLIEIQQNGHTSWAIYIGHAQVIYTEPSPDQQSTNQGTTPTANQNVPPSPGGNKNEVANQNTAAGTNGKDSNIQYQVKKGLLKDVIGQHTVRINNMYDSTRKAFPVPAIVERAELHVGDTVKDRKEAIVNLRYERQMRVWHL